MIFIRVLVASKKSYIGNNSRFKKQTYDTVAYKVNVGSW